MKRFDPEIFAWIFGVGMSLVMAAFFGGIFAAMVLSMFGVDLG